MQAELKRKLQHRGCFTHHCDTETPRDKEKAQKAYSLSIVSNISAYTSTTFQKAQ